MKKKVFGIIIVTCLTIGMSLSSCGSVRDDLAALEKEAGVDTDEEKSISDRLSVLEGELSINVDKEASTSDRIKVLQRELGLEDIEDETEAPELSEAEQATLVAYQKCFDLR